MALEIYTRLGKLLRIKNQKTKTFTNENEEYVTVLVKLNRKVKCLMFTDAELSKALARGEKNKEDQPKQSWISRILD
jgi:IS1 family transposase